MVGFAKRRRRICAVGIVVVGISSGCGGDGSGAQSGTGGSAGVGGNGNAAGGGNAGGTGGSGTSGTAGAGTAGLGAGGGGGATGGGVDTGLDPTTAVNKLGPADAQKICDAEARYVAATIKDADATRAVCVVFAGLTAGAAGPSKAACETSVNDCLSQGMTTSMMSCTLDATALASCTATIGEVETCATAAVDTTAALLTTIDCSIYTLPFAEWQAKIDALRKLPSACTSLEQKCPGAVQMGS